MWLRCKSSPYRTTLLKTIDVPGQSNIREARCHRKVAGPDDLPIPDRAVQAESKKVRHVGKKLSKKNLNSDQEKGLLLDLFKVQVQQRYFGKNANKDHPTNFSQQLPDSATVLTRYNPDIFSLAETARYIATN